MFSNDLFLCFCVVIMNGMDRMDGMDTGGGGGGGGVLP